MTAILASCSLVVDSERQQCASAADCASSGLGAGVECRARVCVAGAPVVDAADVDPPVDPIWGCLGNVVLPVEEPDAPVRYPVRFEELISQQGLEGLPVKACSFSDNGCATAVAGPTSTDATGLVDLQLFSGFRGYLDIQPTAEVPDLIPSLLYAHPIPDKRVGTPSQPPLWNLLMKAELYYVAGTIDRPVRDEYGHLFFAAVDCRGLSAVDTSARAETVTADTFTYYTDSSGTPSITQERTTQSGNGGFLNLPVGTVRVTLSRQGGQRVGVQDVVIRAGTITYLLFGPTP